MKMSRRLEKGAFGLLFVCLEGLTFVSAASLAQTEAFGQQLQCNTYTNGCYSKANTVPCPTNGCSKLFNIFT